MNFWGGPKADLMLPQQEPTRPRSAESAARSVTSAEFWLTFGCLHRCGYDEVLGTSEKRIPCGHWLGRWFGYDPKPSRTTTVRASRLRMTWRSETLSIGLPVFTAGSSKDHSWYRTVARYGQLMEELGHSFTTCPSAASG
jgi:hypothetical protein